MTISKNLIVCVFTCFAVLCVDALSSQEYQYPAQDAFQCNSGSFCQCGGIVAGHQARPKSDLLVRMHTNGDLAPRYPYEAMQLYYYPRPYNYHRIQQTIPSSQFIQNYEQIIAQFESSIFESAALGQNSEFIHRDKSLEFTDWRKHYSARMTWDQSAPANIDLSETRNFNLELKEEFTPRQFGRN